MGRVMRVFGASLSISAAVSMCGLGFAGSAFGAFDMEASSNHISPVTATVGSTVTDTIVVRNLGPDTSTPYTASIVPLPNYTPGVDSANIVSASSDVGACVAIPFVAGDQDYRAGIRECPLGTVAPGQTITITVVQTVGQTWLAHNQQPSIVGLCESNGPVDPNTGKTICNPHEPNPSNNVARSEPFTALPNDGPTAVDDLIDMSLSNAVSVLANDSDPNGDTLTVSASTPPSFGTVQCTAAGVCLYQSNGGNPQPDAFTYTASDGHGGTATASVRVTPAAPVAPPQTSPPSSQTDKSEPEATTKSKNTAEWTCPDCARLWLAGKNLGPNVAAGVGLRINALALRCGPRARVHWLGWDDSVSVTSPIPGSNHVFDSPTTFGVAYCADVTHKRWHLARVIANARTSGFYSYTVAQTGLDLNAGLCFGNARVVAGIYGRDHTSLHVGLFIPWSLMIGLRPEGAAISSVCDSPFSPVQVATISYEANVKPGGPLLYNAQRDHSSLSRGATTHISLGDFYQPPVGTWAYEPWQKTTPQNRQKDRIKALLDKIEFGWTLDKKKLAPWFAIARYGA